MAQETTNYKQGYSEATVASHASRTVESDAGFLVPYIKPTDHVLDVGCGPGTITVGFSALVPMGSVVGVDISEQVLDQARQLLTATATATVTEESDDKLGATRFQRADLLAGLPFADNTFDVVYASQLFPHLATPEARLRAAAEMRRVLKAGGILATRDAAELHFYPPCHGLDRLWAGNLVRALRDGEADGRLPGGEMPAVFRQVGVEKLRVGAGTTVHAGQEVRRWFADACLGRLAQGDAFLDSWRQAGITDEAVAETREALRRWAADGDAWYVALQAEILGWK